MHKPIATSRVGRGRRWRARECSEKHHPKFHSDEERIIAKCAFVFTSLSQRQGMAPVRSESTWVGSLLHQSIAIRDEFGCADFQRVSAVVLHRHELRAR